MDFIYDYIPTVVMCDYNIHSKLILYVYIAYKRLSTIFQIRIATECANEYTNLHNKLRQIDCGN